MNTVRSCGCKGCRTCLQCENEFGIEKKDFFQIYKELDSYVFCPACNKIYKGWNVTEVLNNHENHDVNEGKMFPGVLVKLNFLTEPEGLKLMQNLDELSWEGSQSGRRKQNFGPKTNFKKRKLQNGEFKGFPLCTKFVQEKLAVEPLLKGFQTIEQCTLEYNPDKGASIDPHIDDCWIWGERVVTVNCLGNSVLTLAKYKGQILNKYNLNLVEGYRNKLNCDLLDEKELDEYEGVVIRIPMPNLSLIVLYGPARYQFEHSVLREDVKERRVCLAYREFTPMYLEDGIDFEKGNVITNNAVQFWAHRTPDAVIET